MIGRRAQSLRTAWAHFRETRRKEKMRREVIRKHSQKDKDPAADALPRVRKAKMSPGPRRPMPTRTTTSSSTLGPDLDDVDDLPLQPATLRGAPAREA